MTNLAAMILEQDVAFFLQRALDHSGEHAEHPGKSTRKWTFVSITSIVAMTDWPIAAMSRLS